jgi:hypothetical protein
MTSDESIQLYLFIFVSRVLMAMALLCGNVDDGGGVAAGEDVGGCH